ncbi:uncharacterized protein SOCE26_102770 [Sorangium cellulosum]|uniref:Uncharacterized protein n=1 Tax=Sorangium cellulosum TaxID=56 RepID=A0A2L0FAV5_SORCE|nr:uncharacterized protein SOCE26_102770 [Sorangium cellulosum]
MTLPPANRAHVCRGPAARPTGSTSSSTHLGEVLSEPIAASPSWPASLPPQHAVLPFSRITQVWYAPATICAAGSSPVTLEGVKRDSPPQPPASGTAASSAAAAARGERCRVRSTILRLPQVRRAACESPRVPDRFTHAGHALDGAARRDGTSPRSASIPIPHLLLLSRRRRCGGRARRMACVARKWAAARMTTDPGGSVIPAPSPRARAPAPRARAPAPRPPPWRATRGRPPLPGWARARPCPRRARGAPAPRRRCPR